jgi:hypothetical protein
MDLSQIFGFGTEQRELGSQGLSIQGVIQMAADNYMQQQMAWGQQQFAQNSAVTDQTVNDLFSNYSELAGVGNTLMSTYQSDFLPEYSSLVNDANNYASQARIQQAMGAAESGVAQAYNGQRQGALSDLEGYGIDPSSGRYAELDTAERMNEAAAQAGAGFQAEQQTEATGRALRSEALQLGSVMPSQATAAYNAASGAASAAENAKLANSQEGVNMMGSPQGWGALGLQHGGAGAGPGGKSNSSSPGSPAIPYGNNYGSPGEYDVKGGGNWDPAMAGGIGEGENQGGGLGAGGAGGWNGISQMPAGFDNSGGGYGADTNEGDMTGSYGNATGFQQPDSSFNTGMSEGSDSDSDYAEGGAIPYSASPSRGKMTDDVPAKVNQTGDDIRVNAGEFIMPRHAVEWWGKGKFHKMIQESEKGHKGATAKPQLRPRLPSQRGAIPTE